MFIAHRREHDGSDQPLIDHLKGTAKLASEFADVFDNAQYGYLCGLLHDLGKYSEAFQRRIKHNAKRCDHSSAGAKLVFKSGHAGKLIAYCVAGHHSGLQNIGSKFDTGGEGTLSSRLSEEYIIEDFNSYREEILSEINPPPPPKIKPLEKAGFSFSFFIRMLYSCLVDADFLDTESFMKNGEVSRSIDYDFKEMLAKLNSKLSSFTAKNSVINEKRAEILQNNIEKSSLERGIFTLTVPTGGGKTLSSMAFALNHLVKNKMDRIIYVIPYTSILEQNAKTFSEVFGGDLVLEHHSNFDFKSEDETEKNIKKLSSENWDAPIIVTTNVQFFESLFANKSSKCRKIHNIANSVIIFDEVQMLPPEYISPCTRAISELVQNYKCTAVLCSATQPALSDMLPKQMKSVEICENTGELYEIFKRTKIEQRGEIDSVELAHEINSLNQCLVIVNTRKHALELFSMLEGEGKYHLSTLMCPAHRSIIIEEIKERLSKGQPCRVVSTRLIEAGVDVDFPRVYRAKAGLDSIVQAAGRCNREGKLKNEHGELILGEVHVFKPEEKFTKGQPSTFKMPIEVTDEIMRKFIDISSPEAIDSYFKQLFWLSGGKGLDIKNIVGRLEDGVDLRSKSSDAQFNFDFEDIAKDFSLIDDVTRAVTIPFDENAIHLIDSLHHTEFYSGILRSLQRYSVNIYSREFGALCDQGKIDFITEEIAVLKSIGDYNSETGILVNIETGVAVFL